MTIVHSTYHGLWTEWDKQNKQETEDGNEKSFTVLACEKRETAINIRLLCRGNKPVPRQAVSAVVSHEPAALSHLLISFWFNRDQRPAHDGNNRNSRHVKSVKVFLRVNNDRQFRYTGFWW